MLVNIVSQMLYAAHFIVFSLEIYSNLHLKFEYHILKMTYELNTM